MYIILFRMLPPLTKKKAKFRKLNPRCVLLHFLLTYWWQGSAPWTALYPTVGGTALLGNRSKMVQLTI